MTIALVAGLVIGMTVGCGRRDPGAVRLAAANLRGAIVGAGCPRSLRSRFLAIWCWSGPAARIPVDGVVASGHFFVDQSTIAGESIPVERTAGIPVFAGTINQSGVLRSPRRKDWPRQSF
jgi:hypothetical protein